ncbi:hypothetical protein HWV62_39247 [Athelia sp. TMB]|nr:hypothetical protein HWV62_39247 [Athelia sp. TMB]
MSRMSAIIGSVAEGLANLGRAIVPCLRSQSSDSHFTHNTLNEERNPLLAENSEVDLSGGQPDFAEAAEALLQAKSVVADRCLSFLELPIDGLLDVVNACGSNDSEHRQDEMDIGGILKGLLTLEEKTHSALMLLQDHIIDVNTANALLEKLASSNKWAIAQVKSPVDVSRDIIFHSIYKSARDFASLKTLSIEDIITVWVAREWRNNSGTNQHSFTSTVPRGTQILERSEPPDGVEVEYRNGIEIYLRFLENGSVENLHEAIKSYDDALTLCTWTPDHSLHPRILINMGDALVARFKEIGNLKDLDYAVARYRRAIKLHPAEYSDRSTCFNNLACSLHIRFTRLKQTSDLKEAIEHHRSAVDLLPLRHPNRPIYLGTLASALRSRFNQSGETTDLDEEIANYRHALALCPFKNPNRSVSLLNLANALRARFGHLGEMKDLEEAITHHRDSLALRPWGHPDRPTSLDSLANALLDRFGRIGEVVDLEQAIVQHYEAFELRPPGHPDHSTSLNSVASALRNRDVKLSQNANLEGAEVVPPPTENEPGVGSENENLLQIVGKVLTRIERIANVTAHMVGRLAEVHLHAYTAQKVLSPLYKAYKQRKETDIAVLGLFKQMEFLYSFVDDIGYLVGRETVINRVLDQTAECGIFCREYTSHGFAGQLAGHAVSNRSQMISNLSSAMGQLRDNLSSTVTPHAVFVSSQTNERFGYSDALRTLMPVMMMAEDRPLCLPGTRETDLKNVVDWLLTPSDQNVLWLYGAAGLGKSTIATSIAMHFGHFQRRGALLFFDRNSPLDSAPSRVIPTLAFQLAQQNAAIGRAISIAIEQRPELISDSLGTQFQSLLLEPLSAAASFIEGPLIIILDALDECGDTSSRLQLLELLSRETTKLPSQFRILITSRPEHDIKKAFFSRSHIHAIDLSKASDADMRLYITHEMTMIHQNRHMFDELPLGWPGEAEIARMVLRADGYFIWVATAMKLVSYAATPDRYLENLLLSNHSAFTLEELYKSALLSASTWEPGEMTDAYKGILGLIVISQVPLTDETITALLGFQDDGNTCRVVLQRLRSVIRWRRGQPARMLHKSFSDYLTNGSYSDEPWFIDVQEHQHMLTVACLRIMNSQLHFNMCNLKTSHLPNGDIPDLSARIDRDIPQMLSYPCLFWGSHIRQTLSGNPSLQPLLLQFFEQKFLYWLEVLSLMGEVRLVSRTMKAVKECITLIIDFLKQNTDRKLEAFAQDGLAFSRIFGQAIAFSTPHIYVSCIPFAPRASVIKQQYAHLMLKTMAMDGGGYDDWPALQQAFEVPTDVYAVAFSPDGQYMASGSADGSVRMWNTETGDLAAPPFEGHTGSISSVAFSPDGQRIASGSVDKFVLVWNIHSGVLVAGPFGGHTDSVTSVAFSPDGLCIASGSDDRSVRVWDIRSGTLVIGPFRGHTDCVTSVAFSPDGLCIASGSDDRSVQVLDIRSGTLVVGPFRGHTDCVTSVAFSPDGLCIASGSADGSVRMWNTETGDLTAPPFEGHTGSISSVAFSPDGQRIASGSYDKSVRVWDIRSGALVAGPFRGHTAFVTSVAFSPDGLCIASGSGDKSVRVWDGQAGVLAAMPFKGPADYINSVALSPDGRRIASGSHDCSIRVWDEQTGALVAGPFKGHTDYVMSVAFSPDGRYIVSGSNDKSVRVWDGQTGALVAGPFEGHTDYVMSVAFSPTGWHIASGSHDCSIRVWDEQTGALVAGPFKGHTDYVMSVAFSPDGRYIVSGSNDKSVRVWDRQTGTLVAGPLEGHTDYVTSVAFSPDGRYIVSGSDDNTVRIWSIETGELVAAPFEGHTDRVNSVAFSPDGRCVASGSDDQSIRVWDRETGTRIAGPPEEYTGGVHTVVFSQDGQSLVSSSHSTIRVHKLPHISGLPTLQSIKSSSLSSKVEAAEGFSNASRLEHGWMRNQQGGLLFWVPPQLREGLWWPENTAVISRTSNRLDLERFVHGEEWARCHI